MTDNKKEEEIDQLKKTRKEISESMDKVTKCTVSRIENSIIDQKSTAAKSLKEQFEKIVIEAENISGRYVNGKA